LPDFPPQAGGATTSGRGSAGIVVGLAQLPDVSSGRGAARIVVGLAQLPDVSSGRGAAGIVVGLC
jgi:hypothetical protein